MIDIISNSPVINTSEYYRYSNNKLCPRKDGQNIPDRKKYWKNSRKSPKRGTYLPLEDDISRRRKRNAILILYRRDPRHFETVRGAILTCYCCFNVDYRCLVLCDLQDLYLSDEAHYKVDKCLFGHRESVGSHRNPKIGFYVLVRRARTLSVQARCLEDLKEESPRR